MKAENYNIMYNSYREDYLISLADQFADENNTVRDLYIEEVVEANQLYPAIEEDLADKGFSNEEIKSIIDRTPSDTTMAKFAAYAISLFNSYENKAELAQMAKECYDIDLSDEEIEQISKVVDKLAIDAGIEEYITVEEILDNMQFNEDDLEAVDTEGHTYEGTAKLYGKEYFVHVSFEDGHGSWKESAAQSIYEQIQSKYKESEEYEMD